MKYHNIRALMLFVVLGGFVLADANGAPSVKRFGGNNPGEVKTTTFPTKTSTGGARIGSVRTNKVSGIKKDAVKKNVSESGSKSSDSEHRLSLGKYIHTTGVNSGAIKPVVSVESVAATSNDIVSLSDQVSDLKTTVEAKQDVLTSENVTFSGEGAIVTSVSANNGTVVVNKGEITIPVGAPESSVRAKIWIE